MKKTVAIFLIAVTACLLLFTGCEQKTVLKVYNCYEYMDETIVKDFEKEYNCKVVLGYYDDNEAMLVGLQAAGADYDVVFPSDYTITKMIQSDLLAELDYANIPNFANIDEKYLNRDFDPQNKYSVPYMWGTIGILYNTDKVKEPITSWDILWDEKYADSVYMINSERDAIAIALMKNGFSMNDHSEANLAKAKADLVAQRESTVKAYYLDETKGMMAAGNGAMGIVYTGDAVIAMESADNLAYALPESGTNLWIDGVVVLKSSKNKELAEKFIDFLCRGDIAKRNVDEIGYCTPNKVAYEQLDDEIKNNKVIYPDAEYLEKCEVFEDLGEVGKTYKQIWLEVTSGSGD